MTKTKSSSPRTSAALSRRRRSVGTRLAVVAVALMVLSSVACTPADESESMLGSEQGQISTQIEEAHSELALHRGSVLWPNSISACFRNNGGYCNGGHCQDNTTACTSDSDCGSALWTNGTGGALDAKLYSNARSVIQSALVDNWGASSGLTFNFTGDCVGTPASDVLVVNLRNYVSSGNCGYGRGAHCEIGVNPPNDPDTRWVTCHEGGHALGLQHEHQRLDSTQCAAVAQLVAACQACTDGGCSASNLSACTCSAADFNACLGTSVGGGTQTLTADQYDAANGNLFNNQMTGDALNLTPYDASSVMNYCGPRPQLLTDYDRLGIEILYPKSSSLGLGCGTGCWGTSPSLLARSNGQISDSWKARGAKDWWASVPVWKKSGSTLTTAPALLASLIGTGGTVSFTAVNTWNQKSISVSGSVVVDNAKWTAVLQSAVPAL